MTALLTTTAERLAALRDAMRAERLDAYLVPSADAHQNEYVPACWQRRAWISGFTGSAGEVVVTHEHAGLWTDSRYFLQAERELDAAAFTLFRQREPDVPTLEAWLADHLGRGQRLGFDPRTISSARRAALAKRLDERGVELVALEHNLVDSLRTAAETARPADPVIALDLAFAGEAVADKLARIRGQMAERKARAFVEPTLDAIAWLFNVRGTDIDYNPVVLSYAIVEPERALWFVDERKVGAEVAAALSGLVETRPYEAFGDALEAHAAHGTAVWIDPAASSSWIRERLEGAELVEQPSPVQRAKAVKNATELEGMARAHRRDGVAMVRFLRWLSGAVPAGGVTEAGAAARLDAFRAEGEHFRGLSFPTISAYGPHGAIVHYSVTAETDVPLEPSSLYLVDSGAQYLDGTTDITRTVSLGDPSDEQRDRFTRVLKGHIDLARLVFPKGTTGRQIELAARRPLWEIGLDYGHGTGHGVGCFLNVHEGPFSISQRPGEVPLEPGMISSNEPGYYEAGAFGIRIENLVQVVKDEALSDRPGREFHRFHTITLCPIDRSLVDVGALEASHREWLDAYHRRVRESLAPELADPADRAWLEAACAPLA